MVEERQALLERYRQSRADLLTAIDGLSDEQMTETSIDGWSVKDHLAHISFWDEVRASEVARISAGHESAWRMRPEQDEAQNAIVYDERKDLSVDQVRWEIETSRQRLLDAIASATPRGLDPSLYGEAGLISGHEAQHAGWLASWRRENGL
jgi:uncharacterized damage-inducible protein DinB